MMSPPRLQPVLDALGVGLLEAGRLLGELVQAATRGQIRLQSPLVRTGFSPELNRERLQAEYDRLRSEQAQLHRRITEIKRQLE